MSVPLSALIPLLGMLATAPAGANAPTSLAPIVVEGLPMDSAARIERVLRRAFEARPGAVGDAVARPPYEAARQNGLTCEITLPDCLAQVGIIQGVDQVVLARLGAGDLEVTLLDVGSARVVRRAKGPLRAAVLEADITTILGRLDAPEAGLSALSITAPAGASIDVDGTAIGVAPVGPVSTLAAGEHLVRATLDGSTAEVRVAVELGESTAVTLTPTADTGTTDDDGRPPRQSPHLSTTVPLVVGGSLAAAGSISLLLGGMAWLEVVDAREGLDALEASAAAGAPVDDVFVGDTQVARDRFEGANVFWSDIGIPLVGVGFGVIGAGVGVVVTTLVLARE